jgi:hypothetical protein
MLGRAMDGDVDFWRVDIILKRGIGRKDLGGNSETLYLRSKPQGADDGIKASKSSNFVGLYSKDVQGWDIL